MITDFFYVWYYMALYGTFSMYMYGTKSHTSDQKRHATYIT